MDSLMSLLSKATNSDTVTSSFGAAMSVSNTTLLLIVAISLIGTNLVANITERQSPLDYVIAYCCLFIGSLMATWFISDIQLPVNSELAQTAITANIGMACSALLLMGIYKLGSR